MCKYHYFKYFFYACFFAALSSLAKSAPLKVGIIGDAKWGLNNENPVTGIMREQSNTILKMANLNATHSYAPYPRLLKQLKYGEIDCAILAIDSRNTSANILISYLYDIKAVVITRKDLKYRSYGDFYNKRKIKVVGFPNGGSYLYPKLFNDPRVEKRIIPSHKQAPLMLARKRIDAFIGMQYAIRYEVHRNKLNSVLSVPGRVVDSLPIWLQCSKKSMVSKALQQRLKKAVITVKSLNSLQNIIDKWMSFLFINNV